MTMMSSKNKKLLVFYGLSVLLGLLVGLVGSLIRFCIFYLEKIQQFGSNFDLSSSWQILALIIVSVIFAVVALYLVKIYANEASGSGVQEIEGRLLGLRNIYWRRLIPVKFIGACLAISSKMILGREGPTIQIGGNLGAMLSERFKLNKTKTNILIGAGAASGLAAAFNAPLAGVLFILEEMREHFKLSVISFKSVIIACVMATIVVRFCFGSAPEIHMHHFASPPLWTGFLFFIFGLMVGVAGLFFNKILFIVLDLVGMLSFKQRVIFTIIVASIIGFISYSAPNLVGGGYEIIQQSLQLNLSLKILILILIARFILTVFCYSSGVPGGIFAPLLAIGTLLGVAFGSVVVPLVDDTALFTGMFAVAGMGGLFAACIRAPITGIVLIVEMTQNYQLILPLMITCITATAVVQFANEKPLYHQLLQKLLINK